MATRLQDAVIRVRIDRDAARAELKRLQGESDKLTRISRDQDRRVDAREREEGRVGATAGRRGFLAGAGQAATAGLLLAPGVGTARSAVSTVRGIAAPASLVGIILSVFREQAVRQVIAEIVAEETRNQLRATFGIDVDPSGAFQAINDAIDGFSDRIASLGRQISSIGQVAEFAQQAAFFGVDVPLEDLRTMVDNLTLMKTAEAKRQQFLRGTQFRSVIESLSRRLGRGVQSLSQ